jgi:hypothetical protein
MWKRNRDLTVDVSFGSVGSVALPTEPVSVSGNRAGVHVDLSGMVLFNDANRIRRLTADGRMDQSWGTDGVATLPVASGLPTWWRLVPTSTGYYVLGQSEAGGIVWKIDSNGRLETGFAEGGYRVLSTRDGSLARPWAVLESPDGALFIAGAAVNRETGLDRPMITKLTAQGTVDESYGTSGVVIDESATPFAQFGAPAVAFLSRHRVVFMGFDPGFNLGVVRRAWYERRARRRSSRYWSNQRRRWWPRRPAALPPRLGTSFSSRDTASTNKGIVVRCYWY